MAIESQQITDQQSLTIIDAVNSIRGNAARIKYAKDKAKLRVLGEGSSRIAFLLPDGNVLKLAKSKAGLMQNEAEGSSTMSTFPLFTKIRESAEQFEWIVVEACQEITDDTLLQMFWTNEYVNSEQYQLETDLGEFGCIGVDTFFEPTYFFEDISSFMESFADEFDSGMTAEEFKG